MYFAYGEKEMEYLSRRDKKLAEVIEKVGHVNREVDTDLFSSVVHHIIGQQISMKAQATIWQRMRQDLGTVCAESILEAGISKLQSYGMTFRKAEYLTDFAQKVQAKEFDLEGIWQKSDEEAIRELSALKGIGVWTAEMILLFCMQRPDVFSYGDLAILRGLKILYGKEEISREQFETYRKRFSPYGSVASLYLWAVSGGAVPGMQEYTWHYESPLGGITMASDGEALTGLWFDGQKYFADTLASYHEEKKLPVFVQTKKWLDLYFRGKNPDFTPPLRLKGSEFRRKVWDILLEIPYGETMTYGEVARKLAEEPAAATTPKNAGAKRHVCAQAVGGAVGHNPISLIVPCHRVVGADGSMTGYAGGIDKKVKLLELEQGAGSR
jgi:DNA-3-methyladenine glycosylase II